MLMLCHNLVSKFLSYRSWTAPVSRSYDLKPLPQTHFSGKGQFISRDLLATPVRHSAVSVFHGYIVQDANRLVIEYRMKSARGPA
jgi:hypothetical protein